MTNPKQPEQKTEGERLKDSFALVVTHRSSHSLEDPTHINRKPCSLRLFCKSLPPSAHIVQMYEKNAGSS